MTAEIGVQPTVVADGQLVVAPVVATFENTAAAQWWADEQFGDVTQIVLLCVVADDGAVLHVTALRECGRWAEVRPC